MTSLCTYCSATKSREPGEIPAIRRYQSFRIEKVHGAATTLGLPFRILSGEFGLLAADQPIPYYDHLLDATEVQALVPVLVQQIGSAAITGFVYFTKRLVSNPNLVPYHDALRAACADSRVSFCVVELEEETMGSWRAVMEAAGRAKLAMMSDRAAGERHFAALLAQNPSDGMVYFKRGEAYEALGERALAQNDFQRALAMFPMADWKARAKEAIDRVRS